MFEDDGYDVVNIEILKDGTIKSTTDPISPGNHQSATEFFRLMRELSGGIPDVQKRSVTHQHVHVHEKIKQGQTL